MTHLVLPGGTDVAKMALFSLDALPELCPGLEVVQALETEGLAMCFDTGAEGRYLLHAYIDAAIPDDVLQYCQLEDARRSRLRVGHRGLGFGGMESMYQRFEPNTAIRSDSAVFAADYEVTAYRTEFPEGLLQQELERKLGRAALKLLGSPPYIILATVLAVIVCLLMREWLAAAGVAIGSVTGLNWLYFANPKIKLLQELKHTIELSYPSIVVRMLSSKTSG